MSDKPQTNTAQPEQPDSNTQVTETQVIYRERQWVPIYWWFLAAIVVVITTSQFALNRNIWWLIVPAILLTAIAVWILIRWSSTVIRVELDADGSRWLVARDATLPADVVARSLAVPASAKRNAMGRQLDPAAFVVARGWVPEMVMLVLDDPEDPTPYWLLSSRDPEGLLRAFLPEQADTALENFPRRDKYVFAEYEYEDDEYEET